jgi:hypothetical protein
VIVTKITIGFAIAIYIGLWVIALNGAPQFIGFLLFPLILTVLIGGGAWFIRYMGLPTKSPQFEKRNREDKE